MNDHDRGQVSDSAAHVYADFFVPALFSQWTDVVLDAADVGAGHHVLDVGCGTGVLARAAKCRAGREGRVVGVDPNDGMLAVARRADTDIDWRNGVAEELPFPDDAVDRTVSQFALMFFTDVDAALAEIARVTRPDGRAALAVWDRLDDNVGYARLAEVIEDLFGRAAADAVRAPFALGDPQTLAEIAAHGIRDPDVSRHGGVARFDSLESWLHTEIRGWTLADTIDDEGFARLRATAAERLADLVTASGVVFEVSALVVRGTPA